MSPEEAFHLAKDRGRWKSNTEPVAAHDKCCHGNKEEEENEKEYSPTNLSFIVLGFSIGYWH